MKTTPNEKTMAKKSFGQEEEKSNLEILYMSQEGNPGTLQKANERNRVTALENEQERVQRPGLHQILTDYDFAKNQPGSVTVHGDASKSILNIMCFQFYS